jgi:GNAT superfamily N-acetyltransferase
MPTNLDIRPLKLTDIPAALRLSTQAGWNQIDADWRRLIDLWPESCLAGWHEGRLVATATLATYGKDLGWVGMVLVDEACRGRGFGGAIFDAILTKGDELGVRCLGLDATDMGRPVYLKRGFVDLVGINRWKRDSGPVGDLCPLYRAMSRPSDRIGPLAEFDSSVSGLQRDGLFRHLAGEAGAVCLAIESVGRLIAVGFARRGRLSDALGPIVADGVEADSAMLLELTQRYSHRGLLIDALAGRRFDRTLQQLGFTVQRKLTRMLRGQHGGVPFLDPRAVAAAGFELG